MAEYLPIVDFYEKMDKIISELAKQKNSKVILVEFGYCPDPNLFKESGLEEMLKEIEETLKNHRIEISYYNVEDSEASECMDNCKYSDMLLILIFSLLVVLLLPIDAILRFVLKKKNIADKFAKIIFSPVEKITFKKIIHNLKGLKEYIKNIEKNGKHVIVIVY
ncbi:conserved hypothetical protein [Methanocaldococcus sp. FS406-22]|uniref:hypothetical protein n=1 Tax=Methanocaldococcus sp. (strain FS406-22) TaxID=644281 RepID=UPI0001BF47FA|nr:hypothetical protein [Methanocaldococcus sp. FS406-22]ADC70057.1 conserved hypothetical protein [Methanocaldococcus sp. FS406-22]